MAATSEVARAELGRRLRYWRELAGFSQVLLAQRLGYDPTFICRLELGQRWPTAALLSRADELLGTGGDLLTLWPMLSAARRASPNVFTAVVGGPMPVSVGGDLLSPATVRCLPTLGVLCPLHGLTGCTTTASLADVEPYLVATTDRPGSVAVHGFAGLLAAYIEANLRGPGANVLAPVERCTHALVRLVGNSNDAMAIVLLNLAARFALLAGWLRVEHGSAGMGMVWLQRASAWAAAADSPVATEVLSVMSTVARMEGDAPSALVYAQACAAADPRRRWTRLQGELCLARAYAMLADRRMFEEHAVAAQRLLDSPADHRDATEAPWLSGTEGFGYVQSFLAGGLRDLASRTAAQAPARRAVDCTMDALTNVPTHMRPSHLMLAIRLADAYALAGEPEAAVATAEPVLQAALSARMALINHELRRLHSRLVRGWGELPSVRDFDDRLRD